MWVVRLRGRRIRKGELTGGRRLGVALSNGSISRGEAFTRLVTKRQIFFQLHKPPTNCLVRTCFFSSENEKNPLDDEDERNFFRTKKTFAWITGHATTRVEPYFHGLKVPHQKYRANLDDVESAVAESLDQNPEF